MSIILAAISKSECAWAVTLVISIHSFVFMDDWAYAGIVDLAITFVVTCTVEHSVLELTLKGASIGKRHEGMSVYFENSRHSFKRAFD